jgi:hypothetical protein
LKTIRVKMTRKMKYKIASTVFGFFCTHRTIKGLSPGSCTGLPAPSSSIGQPNSEPEREQHQDYVVKSVPLYYARTHVILAQAYGQNQD